MSYSDIKDIEVGTMVKAKDFHQTWLNAQVVQLDNSNNRAKIHFIDYSDSRFDEWVAINDENLRLNTHNLVNGI